MLEFWSYDIFENKIKQSTKRENCEHNIFFELCINSYLHITI